jgi:hypothetical protein
MKDYAKTLLSALFIILMLTGHYKKAYAQEIPEDTIPSAISKINADLEILKRLKVTGYIQAQFQVADSAGQASFAGGNFPAQNDKRLMVRRGRVKFTYDSPANEIGISTSQYVLQFDVTERGLTIKDAFARITDPWTGWFQLKAGLYNRPFGFEIAYSSSQRESPERGRMSQIVFPNERDLGASFAIQGPKMSNWNWLRLEGGVFNGTGAPGVGANTSDFDKKKDFIGRLSVSKNNLSETIKYSGGVSYYEGGYRVDNDTVYSIRTNENGEKGFFVSESKFKGNYSLRQYMGVDAQLSFEWIAGITTLRAEYIQGKQPGSSSSTVSPSAVFTANLYKRKFNGAYFYFAHSITHTPLQVIVKYDWYDPNTEAKGDEIGKAAAGGKSFGTADVKYETIGAGLAWKFDANTKFVAYVDKVKNETSENLASINKDQKDNVFTLRMQINF